MSDSTPQHAVPQRRLRIFLCHSSADKSAVRDLYWQLRSDGFQPWLDEEDLIPGKEWETAIRRAVRAADVVVVCLTPQAVAEAGFRHKEIRIALDVADEQPEGTIYIIPLRLEACDVPERLRRWHWVNHYEEHGYERLTRALSLRAQDLGSAPPTPADLAPAAIVQSTAPPPDPTDNAPLPPLNPRDPRLVKTRGLIVRKQWVEALQSYEALAAEFTLPQRDGRYFEQARQEAWHVRTTAQAEEAEQRFAWEAAVVLWSQLSAHLPNNTMIAQRLTRARGEQELAAWARDTADLAHLAEWEAILLLVQQIEQQRPGYRHPQIDLAALQRQALIALAYEHAVAQAEQEDWDSVIVTLSAVPEDMVDDDLRALLAHARDEIARQQRERFNVVQERIAARRFDQAIDQLDEILRDKPDDREATTLIANLVERAEVPFNQRWRAAELAGRVGDPRFPVEIRDWQLAIERAQAGDTSGYFCWVTVGNYCVRGWANDEPNADIRLPALWIARFPITVSQYAPFVDVGYAQAAKRWWTPNGWQWKGKRTQPWGWNESPWNGPNQPVVGVSWYEAVAFAAWLTDQLKNALPPDCVIRLPSKAEWEAAAMWDAQRGRMCAWQQAAVELWQNVKEAGFGWPAPIGLFPEGASPCGALDMAGNIWEWCSSHHSDYPEQAATLRDDFTPNEFGSSLRGGSYSLQDTYSPWEEHLWNLPVYLYIVRGFRLCVLVEPRKQGF